MIRFIHKLDRRLFSTKFSRELDAIHAKSRLEIARACKEGRADECLQRNVSLLGFKPGNRPRMIFRDKKK